MGTARGPQTVPPAPGEFHPAAVQASRFSKVEPAAGPAEAGAAASPLRRVGEQILDSLQAAGAQGDRQVVIRLQPPELGTVVVRFQERGEHLEATLAVERGETRRQIEQALPEVVRSLQEAGVPVRRFDVTGGEAPGQEPGRGLSQQETWAGQHGWGQGREQVPAPVPRSPVTDRAVDLPDAAGPERRIEGPPGRIDLLL